MKKYCKHGHNLVDSNLYISPLKKITCRVCRRMAEQKYRFTHPWIIRFSKAKKRCQDTKDKDYYRYGGRGVKFLMTSKDFRYLWFRDNAYSMKRPSIDKIDNDGNYELKNCRFLELSENARKENLGEKNHRSKLTKNQVMIIRKLSKKGVDQSVFAKQFQVADSAIWKVVHRITWKHI